MSLRYLARLAATRRGEPDGFPLVRLHKLPVCWATGHVFGRGSVVIDPCRLEFCSRCGEEIAGRASYQELVPRRADDIETPWIDDLDEDFV